MLEGIAIAATIATTTIAVLHWAPWNKLVGHELRPPWTYIVGLTPLMITYTGWMLISKPAYTYAIIALWAIVGAGGAADLFTYLIDFLAGKRTAKRLRGGVNDQDRHTERGGPRPTLGR